MRGLVQIADGNGHWTDGQTASFDRGVSAKKKEPVRCVVDLSRSFAAGVLLLACAASRPTCHCAQCGVADSDSESERPLRVRLRARGVSE